MRWTKLEVSLERRLVVVAGMGCKVEVIRIADIMVSAILALGF